MKPIRSREDIKKAAAHNTGIKKCTRCKETKPISEYYKSHTSVYGTPIYKPHCKTCESIEKKKMWATLPKKEKQRRTWLGNQDKTYHKNYRLTTKYGITLEQFNEMYKNQKGKCFICEDPTSSNEIRVDHNHKTGVVRKLLCHKCNSLLGLANENENILRKAIDYIQKN